MRDKPSRRHPLVQEGYGHSDSEARPKPNFYCCERAGCAACAWRCDKGGEHLMGRDLAKSHGHCTAASPELQRSSSAVGAEMYHDQQ